MKKKVEVDWIIHGVVYPEGVIYHTHGLDKHGLKELELKLSLEKGLAQQIINLTALELINRGLKVETDYLIEKVFNVPLYLKCDNKSVSHEDNNMIRIIIPDEKGLFPWDEGCNPDYIGQIV